MEDEIAKKVVDGLQTKESEKLIKFLKENNISDGIIMLTMLGLGSHINYYNVLYDRLNNVKEKLTDDIVKNESLKIFYEIDEEEE